MSEEDKIVTKIIGLMEKSVFKPKGLQDLKRQVKQSAKQACPEYTNDLIEQLTELVIDKLDENWKNF